MKNLYVFLIAFFIAAMSQHLHAAPNKRAATTRKNAKIPTRAQQAPVTERDDQGRKVVYQKRNVVDFDAMMLQGDVRNPNEFYFVHRPEEKFGTLVKKRPNFHKEMLRDAVMVK